MHRCYCDLMVSEENVIASRYANALFAEARVSQGFLDKTVGFGAKAGGNWLLRRPLKRLLTFVMGRMKALHGGLWVGGNAVLSRKALKFTANKMNVAIHEPGNDLSAVIALSDVVSVNVSRALVTDIVDIKTTSTTLRLRCFKAKAFAASIRNAADSIRHSATR
jgi:hypothetical protein